MSKCGKSFMPECEYFTTGGCISPFNCQYRIEELSLNSATSVSSIYVQNLILDNAVLRAENAELRVRLENAVELPCKVGDRIWVVIKNKHIFGRKVGCISILNYDIVFKLYNKIGWKYLESVYLKDYNKTWFTDQNKAEARLAELKGGKQ